MQKLFFGDLSCLRNMSDHGRQFNYYVIRQTLYIVAYLVNKKILFNRLFLFLPLARVVCYIYIYATVNEC